MSPSAILHTPTLTGLYRASASGFDDHLRHTTSAPEHVPSEPLHYPALFGRARKIFRKQDEIIILSEIELIGLLLRKKKMDYLFLYSFFLVLVKISCRLKNHN